MTNARRGAVKVDVQVAAGRNAPVRAVLRLEDLLRDVRQGLAPEALVRGARRGSRRGVAAAGDGELPAALAALEKALRRQRALNRRGG